MKAFTHIRIFVGMRTVKHKEPMRIIGKMGRYPVKNHHDFLLVQGINKAHQPLRVTKTGCSGKETGTLIAPAAIKGILHHRHKRHMGKAGFPDIRSVSYTHLDVYKRQVYTLFVHLDCTDHEAPLSVEYSSTMPSAGKSAVCQVLLVPLAIRSQKSTTPPWVVLIGRVAA